MFYVDSDCSEAFNFCSTKSLCDKLSFSPNFALAVGVLTGNLYITRFETIPDDDEGDYPTRFQKSSLTEAGPGLSPNTLAMIGEFNLALEDSSQSTPFLILDIGDQDSRSKTFSRWIVTSSRPYALLRPWWFGTFSGSILNGVTFKAQGRLYPGLCPRNPITTAEDMFKLQNIVYDSAGEKAEFVALVEGRGASGFIDSTTQPYNQENKYSPQDGVFKYSRNTSFSEHWLTFINQTGESITHVNNNFKQEPLTLVTVFLSLIVALFVAYVGFELTRFAIIFLYSKVLNFSQHIQDYSELGKTTKGLVKDTSKQKKMTKWRSLKDLLGSIPSLSEFIDYLVFILHGQFSNSMVRYYKLLFKKNDITNGDSSQNKEFIKFSDVKVLYEQFCFLNYLTEKRLNEPKGLDILGKYGYELITREDQRTEVFVGINIKNYKTFAAERYEGEEESDSLDLYQKNFERTAFNEDQVEVELFIKIYSEFCNYNKLEYIEVNSSLMEERYKISTLQIPQQFIARRQHHVLNIQDDDDDNFGLLTITSKLFFWRSQKSKDYIIDTQRLDNHMKFVMNDIQDLTEAEIKEASLELIRYPGVWRWDGLVVFLHLMLIAILTIPVILFVILNQAEYTPWSLMDPKLLISWKDLTMNPSQVFYNLLSSCFPWNSAIITFVIYFFFFKILGLFLYYLAMTFPVNRLLHKDGAEANPLMILLKLLEWISFSVVLLCYFVYIGMFLMWLLLGAFINPNAFLPCATAAATFGTFVITKYKTFQDVYSKGKESIMEYLTVVFSEFINSVAKKLMQEIKGITGSITNDAKKFLQSDRVKALKAKITDSGIINEKIIEDFEKKVQEMNGQNALSGVLEVVRDPSIIAQGLKDLKGDLVKALVISLYIVLLTL